MSSWFPPPSRPIRVEGGLKARSTRGAISKTWWSQRFIAVLEAAGIGGRLQRGRTYARRGQVISLDVSPGLVRADVQGSRAKPYEARIGTPTFGDADWTRVEATLVENAWYAATLLSGSMPEDIEEVFTACGLSLFPATSKDLSLSCTCPDFAVPCKHLAAVCYLLAESFDDDPFAILAWRGRARDDLLANLQAARSRTAGGGVAGASWRPLADCLDSFWAAGRVGPTPAPEGSAPSILDELPAVDVVVRGTPIIDALTPVYAALSRGDRQVG